MLRRGRMRYKASKRLFSRTASHVNGRNFSVNPMRGGYRL